MRSKVFLISLILFLMVGSVMLGFSEPAKAAVDMIKIATHTVGSGNYQLAAYAAEGIMEKTGISVRCIPAGVESARIMMVRDGTAHAAILDSTSSWCLQDGLYDFASQDWGPQPVRYLWAALHIGIDWAVRGDSDIYKISDLKGKRVGTFPGSPSQQSAVEGLLAFGGLTLDDVITVDQPDAVAAYNAVIQGKLDSNFFNLASSQSYELASMPCGIRYIELPPTDTEGWKRLIEVQPIAIPRLSTVGGGVSEQHPIWTYSKGGPVYLSYANLDEDIAYQITKSLYESYPVYAKKNDSLKLDWTIENVLMIFDNDNIPIHKGAIRYLKEIGKWSEERENMNQKKIEYQEKLRDLWEATVKEAKEKGIAGEEFKKLWMEKRAAAGLWSR